MQRQEICWEHPVFVEEFGRRLRPFLQHLADGGAASLLARRLHAVYAAVCAAVYTAVQGHSSYGRWTRTAFM